MYGFCETLISFTLQSVILSNKFVMFDVLGEHIRKLTKVLQFLQILVDRIQLLDLLSLD